MIPEDRRIQILDLLEKKKYMSIPDLAKAIFVSEPTVRRDLAYLEKEGSLTRTRGGASCITPTMKGWPLILRNKTAIEKKLHIAQLATSFITAGDSIFMDSSTTCFYLAKTLPDDISINVLTYGITVAQAFLDNPNTLVELPGGRLLQSHASIYGKDACDYFAKHYAKTCFISSVGFDVEHGLTDHGREEAQLKQVLHENSEQTIALIDSTKMNKIFFHQDLPLREIDILITDQPLPENIDEACYKYDIQVIYE